MADRNSARRDCLTGVWVCVDTGDSELCLERKVDAGLTVLVRVIDSSMECGEGDNRWFDTDLLRRL